MKRRRLLLTAGVMCVILTLASILVPEQKRASAQEATLTMVSQYPLTNVTINYSTRNFKKWVEAWTGGRIKVDYKGGPEVIAMTELPKAVERGMFDVCFICPPYIGSQYPSLQLFNFVNPANHRLSVRDDKVWEVMSKVARSHGMVFLGVWQAGIPVFPFLAKKPTLDDQGKIESFKGLKIRTGGPFDADLVSAIGGTSVAMHPGEVYEGIRTRLIDGAMYPMNTGLDYRLWELVAFISRDPVYGINGMGLMNAKVFDKLNPETQKMIIEIGKEIQAASYNYTVAITWDGFNSNAGFAKVPTLQFGEKAMQALVRAREDKLGKFAAAEPNLKDEITAVFKKYYSQENLVLNTEASQMR